MFQLSQLKKSGGNDNTLLAQGQGSVDDFLSFLLLWYDLSFMGHVCKGYKAKRILAFLSSKSLLSDLGKQGSYNYNLTQKCYHGTQLRYTEGYED